MQYGASMPASMGQPVIMGTPTLDQLTPGLMPGLDMAFADHVFDAQGGVDDFYAADPEVLSLIAAD